METFQVLVISVRKGAVAAPQIFIFEQSSPGLTGNDRFPFICGNSAAEIPDPADITCKFGRLGVHELTQIASRIQSASRPFECSRVHRFWSGTALNRSMRIENARDDPNDLSRGVASGRASDQQDFSALHLQ